MDKEEARFILRSFRPDGADANDTDFAKALHLAMEDRELGEWLAQERAFDGEFASLLAKVSLPDHLRENIMACLAVERGDYPQAEDSLDAAFIGALSSIQPPASLRHTVLSAMSQTAAPAPKKISIYRRALIPLSIAAGIAMAFLMTRRPDSPQVAGGPPVQADVLRASFASVYESLFFGLDKKSSDATVLINHLSEKQLPTVDKLFPGLEKYKALGCRELLLDGKRGSLICFRMDSGGVLHLVVFRSEDVRGDFPQVDQPLFAEDGKWKFANWMEDDQVRMLITDSPEANLRDFF